jgi:hypothetical protein
MSADGFATSQLLFFVDDDIPSGAPSVVAQAIREMAADREWTLAAPELVDQVDDGSRTLGGVLSLWAPVSPAAEQLPVEIDRRLLADVYFLVERVAVLARQLKVDVGFELDQDPVGWIVNGQPNSSLTEGLLGEWARALGSR